MDKGIDGLGNTNDQHTDHPPDDPSSSATEAVPNETRGAKSHEPGDWKRRVIYLELELEQLRPLKKENQRLQRCVRGVKVLGRAFQETRKELNYLRGSIDGNTGPEMLGGKHSIDTGNKVKDTVNADPYTSYNVPCIKVPPSSEARSADEDDPAQTSQGEPSGGHYRDEHALHQAEVQDNNSEITEHNQDIIPVGDVRNGVEMSDHKQKLQGKVDWVDDTSGVSQKKEGNQRTKQAVVTEVSASSTASKSDTGAKITKDADQETADLDLEDLIKELSSTSTPSPVNQTTPPDVTARHTRSVATTTDEVGGLMAAALARQEIQELRTVNTTWEKFLNKEKSKFQSQLEDKDTEIRKLKVQLDQAGVERKRMSDDYDQMLLTAKTRIDKAEEADKVLQSALEEERARNAKSDQLNRTMARNNQSLSDEIKRLKQALERKHQQVASMRPPSSPLVAEPVDLPPPRSPDAGKRDRTSPTPPAKSEPHQQVALVRSKSPETVTKVGAPLPLMSPADEQLSARSKHGPRRPGSEISGREADLPSPLVGGLESAQETTTEEEQTEGKKADKSLSREELKEKLGLLRQQNQMFRSDFKKEHADKRRAIDELQTVQRELDTNKGRLHRFGHRDHQSKEQGTKHPELVKSSKVKGPKQQLYKPSATDGLLVIPRQAHRKSEANFELKPRDNNEVTVFQWGENTTCKVVNPNTVIIQAEPEGQRLNINLLGSRADHHRAKTNGRREVKVEPFQCPRCQRLFKGSDWEAFEYHVTLCNI